MFTYGTLVEACTSASEPEMALRVYRKALMDGLTGSVQLYTAAVNACMLHGDWETAAEIYTTMQVGWCGRWSGGKLAAGRGCAAVACCCRLWLCLFTSKHNPLAPKSRLLSQQRLPDMQPPTHMPLPPLVATASGMMWSPTTCSMAI